MVSVLILDLFVCECLCCISKRAVADVQVRACWHAVVGFAPS